MFLGLVRDREEQGSFSPFHPLSGAKLQTLACSNSLKSFSYMYFLLLSLMLGVFVYSY